MSNVIMSKSRILDLSKATEIFPRMLIFITQLNNFRRLVEMSEGIKLTIRIYYTNTKGEEKYVDINEDSKNFNEKLYRAYSIISEQ